ncbi:MAG: 1-acyl-sn-glycerol-3-phosphate acyltransferase [Pirellulales bacterium]
MKVGSGGRLSSGRWRHLRREYGVVEVECRHIERLAASLRAGHGVLLTPNHCRPADPFVVGTLARRLRQPVFFMASWHLFMQDRWTRWVLRRMGAFSVYREGMDKAAVAAAIDILATARRPLVIYPEGVITRSNDSLRSLMEGTSLIATRAARRRAETGGRVVVHPVALRYLFCGDIDRALDRVLSDIETRLTWRRPQRHLTALERIRKVGTALLALKEIECTGQVGNGDIDQRVEALINHLLSPIEAEWSLTTQGDGVVARVKRLRIAMMPDIVSGRLDEAERDRRWAQLADCYLAQQLWCYPPDYIRNHASVDRYLETVERFEEDVTDYAHCHRPMRCIVEVDEAIEVSPQRDRSTGDDPLMQRIEDRLRAMLTELSRESRMM